VLRGKLPDLLPPRGDRPGHLRPRPPLWRSSPTRFAPNPPWPVRFVVFLWVVIFLPGCARQTLTRSEIRGITAEIVSAAQRVTGHKTEIAVRPDAQPSLSGKLSADNVYISLGDLSQATSLRQALTEIAHRHKLTMAQTSAEGMFRVDFSFGGNRTHSVHVVTPLAAHAHPPVSHAGGNPQLAIILDDLGHDRAGAEALLALPFPLTMSILPHLPLSAEVAEEAYRRGDQVMLHVPMESESENAGPEGATPEPVELHLGMSGEQVKSALASMLETVPHAAGVNNHQGSRATADPELMQALMPALRERSLFFIDSRTTAATVAYDTAERWGVRAASRKVFLDDIQTKEAILGQIDLAARDALREGSAIAIGHPHAVTISALAEGLSRLEGQGIRLVFASDLVH
jgi:uncharacterized protein